MERTEEMMSDIFLFLGVGGEVEVTVCVCVVGERRDLEIWVVFVGWVWWFCDGGLLVCFGCK